MATAKKLIVEVIDAKNLLPKDGHGTSSPYVIVDFYGQRKRTQTKIRELNPAWNETLEFNVAGPSDVFGDTLELDVYHDKNYGPTRRHNHLGRVRLNSTQFVKRGEEALMYFSLEKKYLLSWIQGEIGLKVYYSDEIPAPEKPPEVSPEKEEAEKMEEVKMEEAPPEPPAPENDPSPAENPAPESVAREEEGKVPVDEGQTFPPEVVPENPVAEKGSEDDRPDRKSVV